MDIDAVLSPLPGDSPSGENLRYTSVYDEIQEARRADDTLDRGDWHHEVKAADWNKAFFLCLDALTKRTKDLQIAAWLLEALAHTKGFQGVSVGLATMNGLLDQFWDTLYPEIEEDDLDFRSGPLEFINDKLWLSIKEIPLTDPENTPGFSWIKWQESRQVGFEKDALNAYGDVDDAKKKARDHQIAEGKITAEEFDAAVLSSSRAYFENLFNQIQSSVEQFARLDQLVDKKFGRNAPRLAELKTSLEDCLALAGKFVRMKRQDEPDPKDETDHKPEQISAEAPDPHAGPARDESVRPRAPGGWENGPPVGPFHVNRILGRRDQAGPGTAFGSLLQRPVHEGKDQFPPSHGKALPEGRQGRSGKAHHGRTQHPDRRAAIGPVGISHMDCRRSIDIAPMPDGRGHFR